MPRGAFYESNQWIARATWGKLVESAFVPVIERWQHFILVIAQRTLTRPVCHWLRAKWKRIDYATPAGWVRFGSLRRVTPLSREFGYDRGLPIDRYYIERFLATHIADIHGHVLEVEDDIYTRQFGGERMTIRNANVGIGTTAPTDKLHVIGDLRITGVARKPGGGSWTSSSDLRLKKKLSALTHSLERLLQLRGVQFEWKEPEKMGNLSGPQTGLVAQEVEKVFPEWVSSDPEGYKELTVRGFEALAIEALRELKNEVEALKKRLDKAEAGGPARRQRAKKEPREKSS